MNQLIKRLLFILLSSIITCSSLTFNVFAKKIVYRHEPTVLPELCKGNMRVCCYNDEISRVIIDYFYKMRRNYNEAFHPEAPVIKMEDMLGLIYVFNEQNGMPLIIHLDGNKHCLIISSKLWSSSGKNFSINLNCIDNKPVLLFYYYEGEGNNVPMVTEVLDC